MDRKRLAIGFALLLVIITLAALAVLSVLPPPLTRETLQQTIDGYLSTLPGLLTAIPK